MSFAPSEEYLVYWDAIQRRVCRLRDRAACGLYTYLPLVVDAIEEVKSGQDGR